ncbi:myosin-binding protein 2 isoform X1 [Arachis duranensis]|uniref:Myosin-binding protein 2 isoform X1 n=1 Tax=Arachis duranensis TaxID=130453 RepID=A0A6P4D1S4_ARADU|nr:myosin-binding protein 2 isoform X1 [Arachis duranensis]
MAANKFATMLHRNTNKITLVLVYAILEWILILLLLLNSLFSYLIIKFADLFGLKRPCMWCTRIDHLIEPAKFNKSLCKDLVCEAHASEISKLGFCSNHHKLAESYHMCEDCSSSSQPNYAKLSQSFGFFPWMKQIGVADDRAIEKTEEPLSCSCCGTNLDSRFYPPCILIKPSLDVLGYSQKQNLLTERGVDTEVDDGDRSDHSRSDEQSTEENRGGDLVFEIDQCSGRRTEEAGESCACSVCDGLDFSLEKGKEAIEEEAEALIVSEEKNDDQACEKNTTSQVDCTEGETTLEIPNKHLEFFIHGDDCRLIPVEFDSAATEDANQSRYKANGEDFILDFDTSADAEAAPVIENWHISGEETVAEFSCQENTKAFKVNEIESIQLQEEEQHLEQDYQDVKIAETTEDLHKDDNAEPNMERRDGESCSDVSTASEDGSQLQGEEFEAEVSIGTEIPDQEQVDEYQSQDIVLDTSQRIQEDPSTSTVSYQVQDHSVGHEKLEEFVEFKTMSLEVRMPTVNNHFSESSEIHENEEERVPETPTSVESLHQIHKKLLLLDRKESGTEESLDGSVVSDLECGEVSIEKLKSALKSERKALSTLYAELEEERSASAVAANQTMAMINRLQEEKAAMQMEALQYQRMMEEQSEYDQEALQLLNELMMKREKEKQELEKELEVYRKKVHEYEVREKMLMMSRNGSSIRSRTSSPSCSIAEDSDGLSIDLSHEAKEENGFCSSQQECSNNQNTPVDAVLYLEESLANFEQERLSIIEQLKVLEEKLIILNYEEQEQVHDDTKSTEYLCEENGNGYHDHDVDNHGGQVNGYANGHANGKHHEGIKIMGAKAKSLLPLFDAMSTEEDVELSGDELEFSPMQHISAEKANSDKKKLALEEEVDHVYERLQVLEADREFLKHCISSLRKGDKGLELLQEILQHLRDLRNVELRVRNMGDLAV